MLERLTESPLSIGVGGDLLRREKEFKSGRRARLPEMGVFSRIEKEHLCRYLMGKPTQKEP